MKDNKPITNNQFALFMFITMSQQAEAWAYMLHGKMKQESKMILNRYLAGAKSMMNHIKEHYDFDQLSEDGSVWGDIMELILKSDNESRQLIYNSIQEILKQYELVKNGTHPAEGSAV